MGWCGNLRRGAHFVSIIGHSDPFINGGDLFGYFRYMCIYVYAGSHIEGWVEQCMTISMTFFLCL